MDINLLSGPVPSECLLGVCISGCFLLLLLLLFIDWTFTKANEYLKKLHNNLAQLKIKRKEIINVK